MKKTVAYNPGPNRSVLEEFDASSNGLPTAHWYHIFTSVGSDEAYQTQLALGMTNPQLYFRNKNANTYTAWKKVIHSANIEETVQTKAYANALIGKLDTSSSALGDTDYFVSQYGGSTSVVKRQVSLLWAYIKGKSDSLYMSKETGISIKRQFSCAAYSSGMKNIRCLNATSKGISGSFNSATGVLSGQFAVMPPDGWTIGSGAGTSYTVVQATEANVVLLRDADAMIIADNNVYTETNTKKHGWLIRLPYTINPKKLVVLFNDPSVMGYYVTILKIFPNFIVFKTGNGVIGLKNVDNILQGISYLEFE